MREALLLGDEERFRKHVLNLYLADHSACTICDEIITPVFHEIGSAWQHGDLEIYQERRSGEIVLRALYDLRSVLPRLPSNAPRAIGATLEHDPYVLPTSMIEVVLAEAGWRASALGVGLPADTLCAAIRDLRPHLVWLSVSTMDTREGFLEDFSRIAETATRYDAPVAVGGRGLDEETRKAMKNALYGERFQDIVSLAHALQRVS
jgi:methanogenic corrinoid protein MtbC1